LWAGHTMRQAQEGNASVLLRYWLKFRLVTLLKRKIARRSLDQQAD
jgi:hypothetical protein